MCFLLAGHRYDIAMISRPQTHIHSFLVLLAFASMHSQEDCVVYSAVLTVFKFHLLLAALYRKLDIVSDSFIVDLFIPLVYRYGVTTVDGFLALDASTNVRNVLLGNLPA